MSPLDAFAQPTVFVTFAALIGLAVGSFLNVVIHRLPKMMERDWARAVRGTAPAQDAGARSRVQPGAAAVSRCPGCGHRIRALENIPLLSYALLRGKCAGCGARISSRYPLVEAFTGAATAYAAWHFGFGWPAFGAMLFLWCMIAAIVHRLRHPAAARLHHAAAAVGGPAAQPRAARSPTCSSAVIGAAAGYLILWSVYWLFKLATGKEGMGFGDFKLLAAIGAWLGWQMLPLVILLSSLVGAVVGIALIVLARRGRNVPIPFGPYLAVRGRDRAVLGPGPGRPLAHRAGLIP